MLYYTYDKSFEGLLTCIFDAYNRKETPYKIQPEGYPLPLFAEEFKVITDTNKSKRVFDGLKKILSSSALRMLFTCFLSEKEDVEILIFNYIQKTFSLNKPIELNFADPDVLDLSKICKKVNREEEKMRQFIRFQKTIDDIFFAYMEPKYNVLPLVVDFFEERFADQAWIIYDALRKYGFYYDLKKTEEICFENLDISLLSGRLPEDKMDKEELYFQVMWKDYLESVTIKERINLKLQRQHMPKRFWKYLTEKQ
jgi:probable DNA metabolism protein